MKHYRVSSGVECVRVKAESAPLSDLLMSAWNRELAYARYGVMRRMIIVICSTNEATLKTGLVTAQRIT